MRIKSSCRVWNLITSFTSHKKEVWGHIFKVKTPHRICTLPILHVGSYVCFAAWRGFHDACRSKRALSGRKKVGIRPFFSELNGKGLKNMLYIRNTKQQYFRDVDNDLTWKKCVCILYFAPSYYITVQIQAMQEADIRQDFNLLKWWEKYSLHILAHRWVKN